MKLVLPPTLPLALVAAGSTTWATQLDQQESYHPAASVSPASTHVGAAHGHDADHGGDDGRSSARGPREVAESLP